MAVAALLPLPAPAAEGLGCVPGLALLRWQSPWDHWQQQLVAPLRTLAWLAAWHLLLLVAWGFARCRLLLRWEGSHEPAPGCSRSRHLQMPVPHLIRHLLLLLLLLLLGAGLLAAAAAALLAVAH
jgi:hypothetical protein